MFPNTPRNNALYSGLLPPSVLGGDVRDFVRIGIEIGVSGWIYELSD